MVRGHHYHGGPIAKKGEKSWKAMTGSEVQIQMAKQTNTENHTTGIKLENRTPNKIEGNLMYMFGIEKKCSGGRQKKEMETSHEGCRRKLARAKYIPEMQDGLPSTLTCSNICLGFPRL